VLAFLQYSPEAASAELQRWRRASVTACHRGRVFDIDVGDPAWDPLWAAAHETALPISFQIMAARPKLSLRHPGTVAGGRVRDARRSSLDEPIATMLLRRCSNVPYRPVSSCSPESGLLAAVLPHRRDMWNGASAATPSSTTPSSAPSDLFRRQVMALVIFSRRAARADIHPVDSVADSVHVGCGHRTPTALFPEFAVARSNEPSARCRPGPPTRSTATNCVRAVRLPT